MVENSELLQYNKIDKVRASMQTKKLPEKTVFYVGLG